MRDKGSRLRELDGLRGVGAFVVVLYHCLLVVPAMSAMYSIGPTAAVPPDPGSLPWWLFRTPVRTLWGGHEAVLMFFVLSGMVLMLPLTTRMPDGRGWLAYYARRLVRLYLPVWAALVLAFALATAVRRNPGFGSTWMQAHPQPGVGSALRDAVLLLGVSNLDSPLWSLRWEVWFSLLLPLFVLVLRLIRVERWWLPAVFALSLVSVVAEVPAVRTALPMSWMTDGLLEYMPIFVVGMILCLVRDRFDAVRWRAWPASARWGVVALVVFAIPARSYTDGGQHGTGLVITVALGALAILAVTAAIVLAIVCAPFQRFLRSRPLQWLGSRSFSIYLVHEPIVVSAALVLGASAPFPWLAVAVPLIAFCLLVGEVFWRLVERRAHLLARFVSRLVDRAPVPAERSRHRVR